MKSDNNNFHIWDISEPAVITYITNNNLSLIAIDA